LLRGRNWIISKHAIHFFWLFRLSDAFCSLFSFPTFSDCREDAFALSTGQQSPVLFRFLTLVKFLLCSLVLWQTFYARLTVSEGRGHRFVFVSAKRQVKREKAEESQKNAKVRK